VLEFKFWENALSHACSNQFLHILGEIFSCYTHIGDNVQFKFGGMGDTFTL
jgi:hypothetical protein